MKESELQNDTPHEKRHVYGDQVRDSLSCEIKNGQLHNQFIQI